MSSKSHPSQVFSIRSVLPPAPTQETLLTLPTMHLVSDSNLILYLVLRNESKPVNIMDQSFVEDLNKVIDWLNENESLQAPKTTPSSQKTTSSSQTNRSHHHQIMVLMSEKSTWFVGADVFGLYTVTDTKLGIEISKHGQRVLDRLSNLKLPTVAAISGTTLGGGLELALACRYRWCADHNSIQLGLPEVQLGVIPGAGGTVRLPRLIGIEQSLKIILAGGSVRPRRARQLGLVDQLIEADDRYPGEARFFQNVRRMVSKLVDSSSPLPKPHQNPNQGAWTILEEWWIGRYMMTRYARQNLDKLTKGNYPAPYKALDSIIHGYKSTVSDALDFEAKCFGELATTQESKNLLSVFFLRERAKKLSAMPRRDDSQKPQARSINQLGVIGAGVMGSGIAQLFAQKKLKVYMKDIKDEFVEKGLKFVRDSFEEMAKKKRLSPEEAERRIRLVQGGTDYSPFAQTQVIVEAAVENMKLKKMILQESEKHMDDNSIFATNTSTLSINELASVSRRPHNVVGMHFFNPVSKMPLVEIIRGESTSDSTVATIYKLSLDLGKIPIVVNDGPGFLVNRILGIYLLEALRMAFEEKANIEQIDQYLVEFGMPMGPFRLFDEVGLDVAAHSGDTLEVLGPRFKKDEKGKKQMDNLLQSDAKGRKTGKGIFVYDEKGKSQGLNPDLKRLAGYDHSRAKSLKKRHIVDRCVLLMVNEACYILEEGVALCAADVDTGMIFGTGFAPFRGGLLSYADLRGASDCVERLRRLQRKLKDDRFAPAPMLVRMAEKGEKFFEGRVQIPQQKSKL